MYKCLECGEAFSDPKTVCDYVPYGSTTVPLPSTYCPNCGGDFEEAYPCQDCGEYFLKDELNGFFCLDCLKENWDKPDDLFDFAKEINGESGINQFALEMFGGIEGVNDNLRLLLKSIFSCNPQMLQTKKDKFIEDYADDLAELWEEQHNEQP